MHYHRTLDVAKQKTLLRTVSTFATAHTFCASRDGPRKWCLLKQRYFCAVYNYAEKSKSCKGLLESEKKIRGNHAYF